jgi:hypothetical protein
MPSRHAALFGLDCIKQARIFCKLGPLVLAGQGREAPRRGCLDALEPAPDNQDQLLREQNDHQKRSKALFFADIIAAGLSDNNGRPPLCIAARPTTCRDTYW